MKFETGIKNILELSSGFSFRGLNMCKDSGVFYIDTDLPEIIENKKVILDLQKNASKNSEKFSLEVLQKYFRKEIF